MLIDGEESMAVDEEVTLYSYRSGLHRLLGPRILREPPLKSLFAAENRL